MLEWRLVGFLGVVAIAACWALAVVLFRVGAPGSVAIPNAKNTPEYIAFRKMQVYEEAVSEAMFEGGITDKERSLLARLRDSLEVSEADADAIKQELVCRATES